MNAILDQQHEIIVYKNEVEFLKEEVQRLTTELEEEHRISNMSEGRELKLMAQVQRLRLVFDAGKKTIKNNLHLADGDNCTLRVLKDALEAAEKENV